MKTLPPTVRVYNRTPEFNESSVPAGLLRAHTTKAGVWAKIVVLEGTLMYRVPQRGIERLLDTTHVGVVEPEVPHEVEPRGAVRFYVEFLK